MKMNMVKALAKELTDNKAILEILGPQAAKGVRKRSASSATGKAAALTKDAASALAGKAAGKLTARMGHGSSNTIKVQYNPQSIKYTASAREGEATAAEGNQVTKTVSAYCTISMSVDLIFTSKHMLDDSVEKQVGQMLGFMMRSSDRRIRFSWANMMIEGEVQSFGSEYNMFDSFGTPISGKMSLTICSKSTIENSTTTYQQMSQERPAQPAEE